MFPLNQDLDMYGGINSVLQENFTRVTSKNMIEKSESIKEIAGALIRFHEKVESVKKKGSNPFFKSKYATLEDILDTIKQPMKDAGLAFTQFPSGENELVTVLMHTSGEFIQAGVKMTPKDSTPQGQGSAITYMRRYGLSAVLGIATEEDDDGNAATYGGKGKRASTGQNNASGAKVNKKDSELYKQLRYDLSFDPTWSKDEEQSHVEKLTGMIPNEENFSEIVQKLSELKDRQ